MKLRLAGIVNDSIVDGPGLRLTVFTQGCPHHCEGCHNPETHDFHGGYDSDTNQIIKKVKDNPLLDGITLSGGEPFCQARALAELSKEINKMGLDVIAYTGYKFEYLIKNADEQNGYCDLLKECRYLIDGRFELENKSLMIKFRGSTNQRIIDVEKSLECKEVIEAEI